MTLHLRDSLARLVIALALVALMFGTLAGSVPLWPTPPTYAALAGLVGLLWAITAVVDSDRLDLLASAALVSLALMRMAGYLGEYASSGDEVRLAAIGSWAIVAALLLVRPLTPVPARITDDR